MGGSKAGFPDISFLVAMPALKNPWEVLENGFRHKILHILWRDAQGAFKCVIVGDGGTGMDVNQQ